jgi:hypothetical protein
MSAPPDREQIRRDLSNALKAIQRDQDVTGLDALVASLTTLGPTYACHGRLLQTGLDAAIEAELHLAVRSSSGCWYMGPGQMDSSEPQG